MNIAMARAHREAFLSAMGSGAAVLRTGPELVRSRDTHFSFRPDSDFWYLTAYPEPDAVLVLIPGRSEGQMVLFVRPRDPEMETWHGRRAGVEGAREIYGADEAFPIAELDTRLPQLLRGVDELYYKTGNDADFDRKLLGHVRDMNFKTRDGVTGPAAFVDPGLLLHEMRLFKSDDELDYMRKAAEITAEAHAAAMRTLAPGVHEYEIESVVNGTFRSHGGSGPGYTSICAGGDNANILHYTVNNEPVPDGACLLLDAGCEYSGYTADVTRCFPASGTFSSAQRELYQVVLDAQLAAVEHVKPGVTFESVHETSTRKLTEGLISLGLVRGSVDEVLEDRSFQRWTIHKTSHWLGLDVHDVGSYFVDGTGGKTSRKLEPGMVLTVEPGIYIPADAELAAEGMRGTGIRIEDDVLVTESGHENLTAAIPKSISEVEAAC
ncbi:MAG: Xaa-Pro aminopeptidase [Planctomycetota bacterium]|nr:MAG: Xaa-Pro aminopeptidase [Planctomycetota bacterium]